MFQALWRQHVIRSQFEGTLVHALVLQKLARRVVAVRRVRSLHRAAMVIQGWCRGHRVRHAHGLKARCTIKLQAWEQKP